MPVALETSWFPAALVPGFLDRSLTGSLYAVLRKHYGIDPVSAQERLHAQDPHRVLHRGYAWVEDATGRPIVSAAALQAGDAVRAVWADGRADAQVTRVEPLPPVP